ncbi:MAG TPA: anti-sigma factor, partial [Gemmataceae bacterium]|nr:anti-sigma factor [Gemmataceae bacterium]
RPRWTRLLPWVISGACAAALLVTLVINRPSRSDPARERAQLLASAPDVIRAKWDGGKTPIPGAGGDVVWSPSEQRGFMRFEGLRVNDPTVEQYQLWIFDRNQKKENPVDGGVFDIPATGEVVVPIRAKLNVQDVYLFAVTVEKPGGVVVSSQERLPLVAEVKR